MFRGKRRHQRLPCGWLEELFSKQEAKRKRAEKAARRRTRDFSRRIAAITRRLASLKPYRPNAYLRAVAKRHKTSI